MALRFRLPKLSLAFCLQAAACGVVAWSLWSGGRDALRTPASAAPDTHSAAPDAAAAVAATADGAAVPGLAAGAGIDAPGGAAQTSPPATASTVEAGTPAAVAVPQPVLAGIDVTVSRNDTLAGIFRRLKLSLADLASLRSLPGLKGHLDSLRPGEQLHLKHRDGELFSLERRLSDGETLKVVREGVALKADVVSNPLDTRTRTVSGSIDSSLFEAVEAAGAHDQTAVALADIFGWDIDFVLDVRHGDSFVVTYQEIWRDGSYLKDGPVLAASFVNQGREYRAVRYTDPTGAVSYYDADGRSVRRAFLRAPLEFTRVSSGFNSARMHPILHRMRAHKGVDYAAPIGTPVKAAGDGTIRFAGVMGGYGNMVEIQHSHSISTVYGHLSRFAHGTRAGAHVTQGTVIAYVGMTGLATGPHLHYEYRVNGVFKNPQTIALPTAEPISPGYREDFRAKSLPLLASLDLANGLMLVSR